MLDVFQIADIGPVEALARISRNVWVFHAKAPRRKEFPAGGNAFGTSQSEPFELSGSHRRLLCVLAPLRDPFSRR